MDSLKELARETIPIPSDAAVGASAFAVRIDDGAIDRLPVGSIVVVDPERPPEPSRYVLAWSNVLKRAIVRRWRATDYSGAGQLIADNPDYPPLQMSVADDGYIVGRVVMLIAEL
jgi:SOS-response transcriptional repressor LexA